MSWTKIDTKHFLICFFFQVKLEIWSRKKFEAFSFLRFICFVEIAQGSWWLSVTSNRKRGKKVLTHLSSLVSTSLWKMVLLISFSDVIRKADSFFEVLQSFKVLYSTSGFLLVLQDSSKYFLLLTCTSWYLKYFQVLLGI